MKDKIAGSVAVILVLAVVPFLPGARHGATDEAPLEVAIPEIQKTDDPQGASPLVGRLVGVDGIVTAVVPDQVGVAGYFIQEPLSAAWAGVYVADPAGNHPGVGDLVHVVATVVESDGLTTLTDVREFTVLSNGGPVPTARGVTLSAIANNEEPWESVRVAVHHVVVDEADLRPAAAADWLVGDSAGHQLRVGRLVGDYAYTPIPTEELLMARGVLWVEGRTPVLEPTAAGDVLSRESVTWISEIQAVPDPRASDASPLQGERVATAGVVTAVFPNVTGGAWYTLQEPRGGSWSGLWVWDPRLDRVPVRGAYVSLSGDVAESFGRTGLRAVTSEPVVLYSVDHVGPTPMRVRVADIALGRATGEQYEGLLVETGPVTVTNPNPDAPDDFGEWLIADSPTGPAARVGDRGDYDYEPTGGAGLMFVRGPVDFTFGDFKLQPRDSGDIGESPMMATPTVSPTATPLTAPTALPSPWPTATPSVVPTPECGNGRCGATVVVRAFHDVRCDGTFDPGVDSGVAGASVRLVYDTGAEVVARTSRPAGYAYFSGINLSSDVGAELVITWPAVEGGTLEACPNSRTRTRLAVDDYRFAAPVVQFRAGWSTD
jgi:hypothetical protein